MPLQFVVDESAVASEVIDGEAIIMQLRTGLYFSSRGTGAVVWELLNQGTTIDSAAELLEKATGGDAALIASEIASYAHAAQSHGLGTLMEVPHDASAVATTSLAGAWQTPVLEVFSDMQDLLLLDPIHDVSNDMGWPVQKPV
jgi:Coenzyme PQQ synthesis protein D (PqqD)